MKDFQEVLLSAGYPLPILVWDFESFFDIGFRMGKYKDSISLTEYVYDERFEITGFGEGFISENGTKTHNFYRPGELEGYFNAARKAHGEDFENVTIVGHNLKFDALVLKKCYGIVPKFTVDTLDLANMYDPKDKHDLDSLGKEWGAPVSKGKTSEFKGVHAMNMNYKKLEKYCLGDIDITMFLIENMLPAVMARPEIEMPLATHTLRMFLNESFDIDIDRAKIVQQRMMLEMAAAVTKAGKVMSVDYGHEDISKPTIFVPLFTKVLEKHGEKMPMKANSKGKMIPALAKTDQAMEELVCHPVEEIRVLAEARVAVGGWPGHIKKVKNTVLQAQARGNKLGGSLGYCRGKTWRWGGVGGINQHNMGGRGRAGRGTHPLIAEVRGLYKAPEGCVLGILDFAAIEARNLAWQAGQDDLTEMFGTGADIYSEFATELFGAFVRKARDDDPTPLNKLYQLRRGFGKDAILGCLAHGTPIQTDNGLKPIEEVMRSDFLWDGHGWAAHYGVIEKGLKECIKVNDVWMTPDHEILIKDGWTTAAELSIHNHSQEWFMENLRFFKSSSVPLGGLSPSNVVALVVEKLLLYATILSRENLHAVMSVLKRHPAKLRLMSHGWQHRTDHGCLTEFVQSLADVKQDRINTMVKEVSESGPVGSQIECLFLSIWQRYQAGMIQHLTSTGLIMIGDMNLEILDSLPGSKTLETADILYSGNWKRFQAGDLLCSNCGYGMGTNKFYQNCYINPSLRPLFDSGKYDWNFIDKLIKLYRHKYSKIPEFWSLVEKAWSYVTRFKHEERIVNGNLRFYHKDGATFIELPSGRYIRYPGAKVTGGKHPSLSYKWAKGIWGGYLTENIIQSESRDILGEAIVRLDKAGYWIALTVHDEVVLILSKETAEQDLEEAKEIMIEVPEWAVGFPIDAEGKLSERYCK